jgi:hypothetical protein
VLSCSNWIDYCGSLCTSIQAILRWSKTPRLKSLSTGNDTFSTHYPIPTLLNSVTTWLADSSKSGGKGSRCGCFHCTETCNGGDSNSDDALYCAIGFAIVGEDPHGRPGAGGDSGGGS